MNKWKDPDWPTPVGALALIIGIVMQNGVLSGAGLLVGFFGVAMLHLGLTRRDRARTAPRQHYERQS